MDELPITLTLPLKHVNAALKGLGELPLKESKDAWTAIAAQAQKQVNDASQPPAPPAAAPAQE